jgi:hypothetical protein
MRHHPTKEGNRPIVNSVSQHLCRPMHRAGLDGNRVLDFDATMRIDHLVWYSQNLVEGREFFGKKMDLPAVYGGEHPGEGTANAVMALGKQTYLEILGQDPAQGGLGLDAEIRSLHGAGLYHWAVGGVDLHEVKNRARAAGLESSELVAGGRIKPDGSKLNWTCLGIRNHGFGALVPFFIDWMNSEHPAVSAPQGGILADFEVHTPRPRQLNEIFRNLGLDIKVTQGPTAGFAAVLESGKGPLTLASFDPPPRGYVI